MTSRPTRPSVTATTATKARVSRPWKVLGARPSSASARPSALGERVPDTADRLDEGRMGRIVLELVSKVAHVDVDRLLVLVEGLVVPKEVQELRAGVDAAGLAREVPQDLELRGCEADPAVAALDAQRSEVDDQVAMPDAPPAGGVREIAVRASEQGLDPAQQLPEPERLREVVVRAELQADDLVDLLVAGGEHEHRRLGARRPQAPQDLEAVHARQSDVDQHGGRRLSGCDLPALPARPNQVAVVALLREGVLDSAGAGVLIFDDEDRGGHGNLMVGLGAQF